DHLPHRRRRVGPVQLAVAIRHGQQRPADRDGRQIGLGSCGDRSAHFGFGIGMQILMNAIHLNTRSNSDRKMPSTRKAQIVMIGIEKLQSHAIPIPPPSSGGGFFSMSAGLPRSRLASEGGTSNATFGFILRKSRGLGSGIFVAGPSPSHHGRMRNVSLMSPQTRRDGQSSWPRTRMNGRTV